MAVDILVPLLTVDKEEPDFSLGDRLEEIKQLHERNQAIQRCFYGELKASELLDLIEAHGINPLSYIEMVEYNLALVMAGYIPLEMEGYAQRFD